MEQSKEHPEFASISRISNCWRDEGQRRSFEIVNIKTSKKLAKVVAAELGRFILSLTIEIFPLKAPAHDTHSMVLLLQSVCNLKFFHFDDQQFFPT